MRAVGRFGAGAAALAVALLLAGCGGGNPAVVAPSVTEVPGATTAPAAAVVLSDMPTRAPDPAAAPAALAESVANQPSLAPIVVQPSGAVGAPADPAAAPAPGAASAPQAPEPAPVQPTPAEPQPAPAAAPAAPEAAVPAAAAPAPDEPAASGEVSQDTTGRPAAPALEPVDGMSLLIEGGSNGRKEVALTFDAGADRGYAEAILDLLRDNGIAATFGMTGAWAEANPDLIVRMASEGHQLINHTWSHDSLTGANTGKPPMTREQLADELARTENIIRELTGVELKPWFRPPYGDYDATTLTWLNELGYPYTAMWTCDTRGWAGWDARKIVDYCTSVPLEDDIILMHVGSSAAGDYEALPELIQYYRDNGYAFVRVEQMIQP